MEKETSTNFMTALYNNMKQDNESTKKALEEAQEQATQEILNKANEHLQNILEEIEQNKNFLTLFANCNKEQKTAIVEYLKNTILYCTIENVLTNKNTLIERIKNKMEQGEVEK